MDFPHSCTIAPGTSNDGFDESHGIPVTSPCNFEEQFEETGFSALVFLPPNTTVLRTSKITLSTGNTAPISFFKRIDDAVNNETEYIRIILGNPKSNTWT
jgi:hypothetical protein